MGGGVGIPQSILESMVLSPLPFCTVLKVADPGYTTTTSEKKVMVDHHDNEDDDKKERNHCNLPLLIWPNNDDNNNLPIECNAVVMGQLVPLVT